MHKDFRYGLLANETLFYPGLTLHNLQYIHRTGFCTDSAGNALRCGGRSLCLYHQPEGTGLHALAAAGTQLFIYHVHTLGVLCDGSCFTSLGALAALGTGHRAHALLLHNLNTCLVRIKLFIECLGACPNTLQAGHTGRSLFHHQFLHLCFLRVSYKCSLLSVFIRPVQQIKQTVLRCF